MEKTRGVRMSTMEKGSDKRNDTLSRDEPFEALTIFAEKSCSPILLG